MGKIHFCAVPTSRVPLGPLAAGGLNNQRVQLAADDFAPRIVFTSDNDAFWVAVWFRDAAGALVDPPTSLAIAVLPLTVTTPANGHQPLDTQGDVILPSQTYDQRSLISSFFPLRPGAPTNSATLTLHPDFALPNGNNVAITNVTSSDPTVQGWSPPSLLTSVRVFFISPSGSGLAARAPMQWGVYVAGSAASVDLVLTTEVVSAGTSVNGLLIPWLSVGAPPELALQLAPQQTKTLTVPVTNFGTGAAHINLPALAAQYAPVLNQPGTPTPIAAVNVTADASVLEAGGTIARVDAGAEIDLVLSFTAHPTNTGTLSTPAVTLGAAWTDRPPPTAHDGCSFAETIPPITIEVSVIEVVLVLDRSGSMAWQETSNALAQPPDRRWDHLVAAADSFIDGYQAVVQGDPAAGTTPLGSLGVVLFSSSLPGNVEVLQALTPVVPGLNVTVRNSIALHVPNGGTPIRAGLEAGLGEISSRATLGRKWILLLSDGDENIGSASGVFGANTDKDVNLIAVGYGPSAPQALLQTLVSQVLALPETPPHAARQAVRFDAVRHTDGSIKDANFEALQNRFLDGLSSVVDFSGLVLDPIFEVRGTRQIIELPSIDESHLRVHIWVNWSTTVPRDIVDRLELILISPTCQEHPISATDPGLSIFVAKHHVLFALDAAFLDGVGASRARRGQYRLAVRLREPIIIGRQGDAALPAPRGGQLPEETMFVGWQVRAQTEHVGGQLRLEAQSTVAGEPASLLATLARPGGLRDFTTSALVTAPTDTFDNWVAFQTLTRQEFAALSQQFIDQGVSDFFELLASVLSLSGRSFRATTEVLRVDLSSSRSGRQFTGSFVPRVPGSYSAVGTTRGESLQERRLNAEAEAQLTVGARIDAAQTVIDFELVAEDEALVHFWFWDALGNRVWQDATGLEISAVGAKFLDVGVERDPELKSSYRRVLFGTEAATQVSATAAGVSAGQATIEPPARLIWAELVRDAFHVENAENAVGPFTGPGDPAAGLQAGGIIVLARKRPFFARALTVFNTFSPASAPPSLTVEARFQRPKGHGPWVSLGSFERNVFTIDLSQHASEALVDVRISTLGGASLQAVGFVAAPEAPPQLADFAVYGSQAVRIADRVRVLGVGGRGFAPLVNGGQRGGETNLGVESETGSIFSRAPVVLRDRAHVFGSVLSTGRVRLGNGAKVEGSIEEFSSFEVPDLPTIDPIPDAGRDVIVRGRESLAPGSYRTVQVFSGGELTLAAGHFSFQSFLVEPGASIVLPAAPAVVVIQVDERFFFRGQMRATGAQLPNPFITFAGSEQVSIERQFFGTIVAPRAKINCASLPADTPYHASFFAREVELQPGSVLIHQPPSADAIRVLGESARTNPKLRLSGIRQLQAVFAARKQR